MSGDLVSRRALVAGIDGVLGTEYSEPGKIAHAAERLSDLLAPASKAACTRGFASKLLVLEGAIARKHRFAHSRSEWATF